MQKARKPSDGSFLVFKSPSDLGLRAGPGFEQGLDKGDESFDLMTVSPRIELRDKFGQASGTRVWVLHKPRLSPVDNSLPLAYLQKLTRLKDVLSVIHSRIINHNKFKGKQQISLPNFGLIGNMTRFSNNLSSCCKTKSRGILKT
jgi:hypothetical protein